MPRISTGIAAASALLVVLAAGCGPGAGGGAVRTTAPRDRSPAERPVVDTYLRTLLAADREGMEAFWRCALRAGPCAACWPRDPAAVTAGLARAFADHPTIQPTRLKERCMPLLRRTAAGLTARGRPPPGFGPTVAEVRRALAALIQASTGYADRLHGRGREHAVEEEIRSLGRTFHYVAGRPGGGTGVAYWKLMRCLVPGLVKRVRKIRRPPDSQPLVDHLVARCLKQDADPGPLVAQLRGRCFEGLSDVREPTPALGLALKKMREDSRDLLALDRCFRRASRGFARTEQAAVARAVARYRAARRALFIRAREELVRTGAPGETTRFWSDVVGRFTRQAAAREDHTPGDAVQRALREAYEGDLRRPGRGESWPRDPCVGLDEISAAPGTRTRVGIVQVAVQGELRQEIVRHILQRHINEVRFCWERRSGPDAPRARQIAFEISVGVHGQVDAVSCLSLVRPACFGTCLARAHLRWLFPRGAAASRVSVTYALER